MNYLLFILLLFIPLASKEISYIKEYTYSASDYDSKVTSRSKAIQEIKEILLNQVASYVKSSRSLTIIDEKDFYKEDILSVTAGITQFNIINEMWNGKIYWIKAKVDLDPDDIEAKIDAIIKNDSLFSELKKERQKSERMLQENTMLTNEIKKLKSKNELLNSQIYTPVVTEKISSEKTISAYDKKLAHKLNTIGESMYHSKQYSKAETLYNAALKIDPEYAQCYSNLALLLRREGRLTEAIVIGRMAISTASGKNKNVVQASTYYNTGRIYESQGKYSKALLNYQWANMARERPVYITAIQRVKELQ